MKLDQSSAEVQDNLGRKVRAKILVDAAGRHVRDPMTDMPLIVDEDFDINHAIAFGRTLAPLMDPSSDPSATAAALAAMYAGGYRQYQKDHPWDPNANLDTSGPAGNAP
jgi:hypothetical protein